MHNKTRARKLLSLMLCVVLIAAVALFAGGCGKKDKYSVGIIGGADGPTAIFVTGDILGEGEKEFAFTVTDSDGKETSLTVKTDCSTVGEALVELGLISGEDGPYGLYVKSVLGTELDFDKDKMYWAFYVDGGYASSGVDTTEIEEGKVYSFRAEK